MTKFDYSIKNISINDSETLELFAFETTILFQLKGKSIIHLNVFSHHMEKGFITIVNRNERYSVETSDKSDILINLSIDNTYFLSLYDDFLTTSFECFPQDEKVGKIDGVNQLRIELSQFLIFYLNNFDTKNINLYIILNKIILTLISYFKKESDIQTSYIMDKRIVNIMKYIEKNFNEDITIEGLANQYYISSSTLSKLFKSETGKYFSDYLNEIRVSKSLKDLLYTGNSIEDIALQYGFNNSKTYRRRFKQFYGLSPTDYKNKTALDEDNYDKNLVDFSLQDYKSEDIFETVYSYINIPKKDMESNLTVENHTKLIIDYNINRNQILPDKIVHMGSLDSLLEFDIISQLDMVIKEIGVDYIGISSIYEFFPGSYKVFVNEELQVYSNLGKFDPIVEMLLNKNIGLFYQINLRDGDRGYESGENAKQLIEFLKYVKNMYGNQLFKKLKINFIFSDENLNDEYNQFYNIYSKLKEFDSSIKFGASIPLRLPDYTFSTKEDMEVYSKSIAPLCDFLSFSCDPNEIYEHRKDMIMDMEIFDEYVYKESVKIKNTLSSFSINLPIILTEWNTLTGERQDINGIFFRAAIILQEKLKLDLEITAYGFWINAGIYNKFKFNKLNKYNGLELFHNYNGKKPVYHALSLASRLKGNILFLGKNSMLLSHDDEYQLLLWNSNYFNPSLSRKVNFLESQAVSYHIEIPDIQNNHYQVKRFDLNRYAGAIYYDYQNYDSMTPLDFETHKYISSKCQPKLSVFDINVRDGLKFNCILDTNAIVLLELKPVEVAG